MHRKSLKSSVPLVLGIIGMMAYIGYFIVKDSGGIALDICVLLPPIFFLEELLRQFLQESIEKIILYG